MVTYNAGSLLHDASYQGLRRQLGLGEAPQRTLISPLTPKIGQDYLRDPNNAGALGQLLSTSLQNSNPMLARLVLNRLGDLMHRYQAALSLAPDLQPDQFLNQFNLDHYAKGLTAQDRGERPFAYLSGMKYLGG